MSRWLLSSLLVCSALAAPRFEVSFPTEAREEPADGRVILIVSKPAEPEPRFQVSWNVSTAQIFGVDVDALSPGETVSFDEHVLGHPLDSLRDLEPGTYDVQAVLHLYETFHRADGHTVKLPMDDGEGQQWNRSPGNLYSEPRQVEIGGESVVSIEMNKVIPPIDPPEETRYVRHVRVESRLLTEFWGRPMHLGAIVLVPEGFDENPDARYPVLYKQGHFPRGFAGFDGRRAGPRSERFHDDWVSGRLPRMLIVLTQHPTPYYDDSYGVNSANMGPYGSALTEELYPHIEEKFRAIGEPWARLLYGGSTGGWISLAEQVSYPDFFGGAWGFCPDPVDFRAFQLINAYEDTNAFYDAGPFKRLPKPVARRTSGHLFATVEDFTRQELVLGEHGRSGGQLDAFHALFGSVGPDGYPAKLWDPITGEIDSQVAEHWRQHHDLAATLERDWGTLGEKLVGKLHITMGTKDTFYLDGAVRLLERFLESTEEPGKGPYYGGSIEYGNNEPHCYVGDLARSESVETHYLPIFAEHMRKMAPEGADTKSWME